MKKIFLSIPSYQKNQAGFTLVETIVAIFILALTIGGLLSLTAGGFFAIRYAKNDIVATNLLQESLEYIRNSRDTASQTGTTWDDWYQPYQDNDCEKTNKGCMVNPYASGAPSIMPCPNSGCTPLNYYVDSGFYGYGTDNYFDSANPLQTSFVRTVTFKLTTPPGNSDPELIVTAKMEWLNGTHPKQVTQSIILTRWNLQ